METEDINFEALKCFLTRNRTEILANLILLI